MKRSGPLKRTGRLKAKKRIRKVSQKEVKAKDLDRLCRELTFKRDGHYCLRCGREKNLQWCHVSSRRFKSTRWADWNVMTLCAACHFWWHDRPVDAAEWFKETFPDRYQSLKAAVPEKVGKREMELIKVGLETLLKTEDRCTAESSPAAS